VVQLEARMRELGQERFDAARKHAEEERGELTSIPLWFGWKVVPS
jgi:vacuolar-type H+-ATPase subunit H